jgi:tripartite-type tricarboxylate transporter receptor subunit TctC
MPNGSHSRLPATIFEKRIAMRFVKPLHLALISAFACATMSSQPLVAQTWPQRPVRVIVPLPAGTAIDVSARLFGEELSHRWKQPVIVENIPGADGILAAKEFASRSDGQTLLYSFAGLITINPFLYKTLPYDPGRDLVPIAITSDNFLAIAASKKSKVNSLGDVVGLAKSQPGKLNWAATAGIPYFAFAGFQKAVGIDMTYVAYRDFNPAVADLGEGRIDIASTALTQLLPQEQAGRATLLAVMNRSRSPASPHIPTATESGFPDLTFDGVTGFFGSRGMSAEMRDRLAQDIRAVTEIQSVRDRLPPLGIVARSSTSAEFAAAIEEQRAKIAKIAAALGTLPQ